jgi:hypothetical protein
VLQRERPNTTVSSVVVESDLRPSSLLDWLNCSDDPRAKGKRLNALCQHTAWHHDPQNLAALLLLHRALQQTERFKHDAGVGRMDSGPDLRDRRVSGSDTRKSLLRDPFHQVLAVPLAEKDWNDLHREKEMATSDHGLRGQWHCPVI